MDEIRTVTSKGQVTIPEAIRREMGINAGDRVIFRYQGDGPMVLEKDTTAVRATAGLLDRYLLEDTTGVKVEDMKQAVRERVARDFQT